jgi:DNA primase
MRGAVTAGAVPRASAWPTIAIETNSKNRSVRSMRHPPIPPFWRSFPKGASAQGDNTRARVITTEHTAIADDLRAHYARVAPLLHAAFGGMPIVSASFPDGIGTKAHWHTKPLPLEPSIFAWCLEKLNAVEFHSWFPAPGRHDRCGMARIFLELAGSADDTRLRDAARITRTALSAHELDAICMLDGTGGIALLIPFDDAPDYDDVRAWLHTFANDLAAKHGDLFTTEPNTRGGTLVHIHVSHNALRMYSALPYSARGLDGLPIALPITWDDLDTIPTRSITIADFPTHFKSHGDTLFNERHRIGEQRFASLSPRHGEVRANGEPRTTVSIDETIALSKGTTISAAMHILADGVTRSADAVLAEAVKQHLLAADYKAKYVYTALIEYIARANGNGRKPYIIQDENRNFRINEPEDDWPNLNPAPPRPPDPQAQALVDRLRTTAYGSDPAAFEVAVCDAFAHMGFLTNHVGGNKAPDGYADAILGTLGYRVMIECKTAKTTVSQPDAFEAAKYKDAFKAQYCTLIGPAFPDEIELTQELKTHGVSAWTLDDLTTALLGGANTYELRACFEPGYAADGLIDVMWDRDHGVQKRIRTVAELTRQVGTQLQTAAARSGPSTDSPLLTVDTAMALVDQALMRFGSTHSCTRADVIHAFQYLTNPITSAGTEQPTASIVVIALA